MTRESGFRAIWTVPYEDGVLEVQAGEVRDRLATPGKAVRIMVDAERKKIKADGRDVLQLEVLLLDGQGNPARDEAVYAQVTGDLTLLGMENGRPDDLTPYFSAWRLTREGSVTVYLRAGEVPGKVCCHFRTKDGLTADWQGRQA